MSNLSAPLAASAPPANGVNPGLRANAGNPSPESMGNTPSFSSVLKDKTNAASAAPKPAEKADRPRDQDESAAARPAEHVEKAVAPAKKPAKDEAHPDEPAPDAPVADDAGTITPIAAVMMQLTPAALVAATTQGEGHAAVTQGALVQDLARGHGRSDKQDVGSLAVGHAEDAGTPGLSAGDTAPSFDQATHQGADEGANLNAADPTADPAAKTLATAGVAAGALSADDDGELSGGGRLAEAGSRETDFTQVLSRARDGQSVGASGEASLQSARTDATLPMRAPVGHPNWSNELGDKMTWMVTQQKHQADLVLNPPQLGRIEVSLTVSGDQASAVFTSPNAAVREMLENSLPRLREILAGSGLNLGQADVGAQSFAQQQQQAQDNQRADALARRDSLLPELPVQAAGTLSLGRAGQGSGVVDIFA